MFRSLLCVALLCTASFVIAAGAPDEYSASINKERSDRDAALRKPGGWLSLIGLDWLSEGRNSIGSSKDSDIVLLKGPLKLGVITLKDGKASIAIEPAANATVDGKSVTTATLASDADGKPSIVAAGSVSFFVIQRNDKIGLRIKDADAEALKHFLGIDYFDVDPSWRVEARWVTFETPQPLQIPDAVGTIYKLKVPGKAVFEHAGQTYELLPMNEETKDGLFFVFADKTSGKITYGGGRFLDTEAPVDGKLILDFNLAYDPPCAFTPYATCPLAPPENRLKVAVEAGEKKYRGGTH
ncbi:MAG: DUF1684 domain-containing protein [Dokdonella sp.]